MKLVTIVVIIVFLGIYSYIRQYLIDKKLANLCSRRDHMSDEEYVQYYMERGYKRKDIEVIRTNIRESYIQGSTFVMHPEDDLYKCYEINPNDIMDNLIEVCASLGKDVPKQTMIDRLNSKYQDKPMTLEYMLEFVNL